MTKLIVPHRVLLVLTVALVSILANDTLWARTPDGNVADLQQQLESGLKARRPQEFEFIARVVTMVNNNRLPLHLVKSTFHWAREKARYKKYPYPYFEWALRERARQLGIRI